MPGFRFPSEVITVAIRWYLRYRLSYRDVELLLAERGIKVDHVTVYRWVQRFTPLFIEAARPCRHTTGDRWFVDETSVKASGRWRRLSPMSGHVRRAPARLRPSAEHALNAVRTAMAAGSRTGSRCVGEV